MASPVLIVKDIHNGKSQVLVNTDHHTNDSNDHDESITEEESSHKRPSDGDDDDDDDDDDDVLKCDLKKKRVKQVVVEFPLCGEQNWDPSCANLLKSMPISVGEEAIRLLKLYFDVFLVRADARLPHTTLEQSYYRNTPPTHRIKMGRTFGKWYYEHFDGLAYGARRDVAGSCKHAALGTRLATVEEVLQSPCFEQWRSVVSQIIASHPVQTPWLTGQSSAKQGLGVASPSPQVFTIPDAHVTSHVCIGIVKCVLHTEFVERMFQDCVAELLSPQQTGALSRIVVESLDTPFEIPSMAQTLAETCDAVICLGVFLESDSHQFDFVASTVTDGLMRVCLDVQTPVIHGVIFCRSMQDAISYAGLNDDVESEAVMWARSGIEMATMNLSR